MRTTARLLICSAVLAAAVLVQMLATAQTRPAAPSYSPPKTPWGHPDISGIYTNKDEANTPLERPDQFKGRSAEEFSTADLDKLTKERQAIAAKIAGGIGGAEFLGAPPLELIGPLERRVRFVLVRVDAGDVGVSPRRFRRRVRRSRRTTLCRRDDLNQHGGGDYRPACHHSSMTIGYG